MTDKQIARREGQEALRTQTPDSEKIYVPNVDIREDSECIRLEADMPGVEQESVDVSVDNGVLTIEGKAWLDIPQGCQLVGQEYGVGRYRRDFTLSDAVDVDSVKARVRQGVLEVTLPKREKVKTRKIKIEA